MILVTGGAGFIGSNLVAALEARGANVVVSDFLGDGEKWRNLAKRRLHDFLPPAELAAWLAGRRGIEAVFHLGAISATTATDGDAVMRHNFNLSLALWRWCAEARRPFIYASSAATYGDGTEGFDDDNDPDALARLRPLNLYGFSKHLFDRRAIHAAAGDPGAPPHWAGLKFFNVYGPNEYHKGSMKSVVAQLYPKVKAGEPARLFKSHHPDYEDGGQRRDFVHVDDCVAVMQWLLEHPEANGLFNVGSGTARTFRELAEATMRAIGREPAIEYIEMPESIRDRYQYHTCAELGRLRAAGFTRPMTRLEAGVTDYVSRYLDTSDPYR